MKNAKIDKYELNEVYMKVEIQKPGVLQTWIGENVDTQKWEVCEINFNRYLTFFKRVNEKKIVGKGHVCDFFTNPEMNFGEFFVENGNLEDVKAFATIRPLDYLKRQYGNAWNDANTCLVFLVNKEKKIVPRLSKYLTPLVNNLNENKDSLNYAVFNVELGLNDWAIRNIERCAKVEKLSNNNFKNDFVLKLENSDLPEIMKMFKDKEHIIADFYLSNSFSFLESPKVSEWVRTFCLEKKLEKIIETNSKSVKKEILDLFAKDSDRDVVKNLFKVVPEEFKNVLIKNYQYLETDTIDFDSFLKEIETDNISLLIDIECFKKRINSIIESNIRAFFKETVTEVLEANGYDMEDYKIIRASKYLIEAKKKNSSYPDLTRGEFVRELLKGWNHLYSLDERFNLNAEIIKRELKAFYLKDQMSSDIQENWGVSTSERKVRKF